MYSGSNVHSNETALRDDVGSSNDCRFYYIIFRCNVERLRLNENLKVLISCAFTLV
jgi:hypothetical protein